MKQVPLIYTSDCVLSEINQNDISRFRELTSDPDTCRFMPELCEWMQTKGGIKQFILSFDKYRDNDEGILWGIRKCGMLIGFIAIMDLPIKPSVFYVMHPAYRNEGYMKECLHAVMKFCLDTLSLSFIQTYVMPKNDISRHVLTTIGFRYERCDDDGLGIYKYSF